MNFYYFYYPILCTALALILIKYHKILLSKKDIFIWGNFAFVALFVLWFFISLFTTDYKVPWYAWHTITGHHFYDLLFGFIVPFFYIWIKKLYRPVYAFLIVAFTIAVNEWAWWIVYYIEHYVIGSTQFWLLPTETQKFTQQTALLNLTIYNTTGMAYIIVIATFIYLLRPFTWKPSIRNAMWFIWFAILIMIYAYWLKIGFPITIDFSGITSLYTDYNTNMIEILHWIIPQALLLFWFDSLFVQKPKYLGMPPSFFKRYLQGQDAISIKVTNTQICKIHNILMTIESNNVLLCPECNQVNS